MRIEIEGVELVDEVLGGGDCWERSQGSVQLFCYRLDGGVFEVSGNSRGEAELFHTARFNLNGHLLTAFSRTAGDPDSEELIYAKTDVGDIGNFNQGQQVCLKLLRQIDAQRANQDRQL